MSLFTFGYEGLSINDFIARLKEAGVQAVFDVRELPLSRKKGFSKSAFGAALHDAGILYTHLPIFGCPRPIRDAYKKDGDWGRYKKAFGTYLSDKSEAVSVLARFTNKANACLVCFEADFNRCHRSLVAQAAARAGGSDVIHLTAKAAIAELPVQVAA